MSTFAEVMTADPPRLVVNFRRGADGGEDFEWGIVGVMPILSLIGRIAAVQVELGSGAGVPQQTDFVALVITWDAEARIFRTFVHPVIPGDPLVGMLEMVKDVLISARAARQMASQKRVLGPDGNITR